MSRNFRKMLAERQEKTKTLVCVGLDPLIEKIPEHLKDCHCEQCLVNSVGKWMQGIVDATAEFASMFKPQSAHWEALGTQVAGLKTLQSLISYIHEKYPDIPVFLDCKRGDIARTQQQYRVACLDMLGVDGMNFSPYMGKDCMAALVDKENPGRALVGLCYTSNPDAREVQDIGVEIEFGKPAICYWEFVAKRILAWAEELGVVENAGLVMAAAYKPKKDAKEIYSAHLVRCRELVGDKLWFLIPGVGAQGGFIEQTVKRAYAGPGSIAINSSSKIDFASSGTDFMEAAAVKARELRDAINSAL